MWPEKEIRAVNIGKSQKCYFLSRKSNIIKISIFRTSKRTQKKAKFIDQ